MKSGRPDRRTTDALGRRSLALHRRYGGKLAMHGTVPLANRRDLAIAYTPGVGAVSSYIATHPKSVRELTIKRNTIAVVSDGSAVLGLGNLGAAAAIPVIEGKALLFKQFGGVDAIPICLDTHDPDEIVRAVEIIAPLFGGINLEDIAAPDCFSIEKRLKTSLHIPVFHDDQHGTATVVLAGILNALTVRKLSFRDARIVIHGAGAAGTAVTHLLCKYGFRNITVLDRKGIIYATRSHLVPHKRIIANLTRRRTRPVGGTSLTDALRDADIFIGVSSKNLLTASMIRTMRPRPIIFALANPVPEIMPDEARRGGAFIIATGRSDFPNQVNNVLVFPGVFRGALDNHVRHIVPSMLIRAAKNLAGLVRRPTAHKILPDPFDDRVVRAVARAICPSSP